VERISKRELTKDIFLIQLMNFSQTNNINFLLRQDEIIINRQIIEEALVCSKPLGL